MSKSAPTIRSRLVLLVTACIVPASLLVAALIVHDYRNQRDQIVRDSKATARALMGVVDRDLAGTQAALFALAASPYLAKDDLSGFYGHARDVLTHQRVNNIVLIDTAYRQRINTLLPFGSALPVEHNSTLRRVFDVRGPVTTDIFVGPVTGRPIVAVAVPVMRNDSVSYVLAAGIWPERMSQALTEQHLPSDWIGVILDSTGTIVARTHEPGRFVGRKAAPALVARLHQVADDALESTTLDGNQVLFVFSKSAISSWTVAIGVPIAAVTGEVRRSLWLLIAGTALLLAVVLALASRIASRIAASIRSLVEPALALGRGEAVTVPPLGVQEADEVASALARASRMLIEARHQANHDPLTGLANRAMFQEILGQQLAVCRRTGAKLAVLVIDLDGFKAVNDLHGHAAGDEVLRAVATRLEHGVRESDLAARLGGDEFAVILVNSGREVVAGVCDKLIENLSSPYPIGAQTARISASIGVAAFPDSGATIEALLQRADEAMYEAKSGGKRRYAEAGVR